MYRSQKIVHPAVLNLFTVNRHVLEYLLSILVLAWIDLEISSVNCEKDKLSVT